MRINGKRVFLIILTLAIGILAIRSFFVLHTQKVKGVDTSEGVSAVSAMNTVKPAEVEDKIRKAQEKIDAAKKNSKRAKALSSGDYETAFEDVCIVGDSLMEALLGYDIMPSNEVVAKVGGTTYDLADSIDQIVKINPKYIVLHYGNNQISTTANADRFMELYLAEIKKIKKRLPQSKIYVESIFPVGPGAVNSNSYLGNIGYYNKKMKKMCDDNGFTYIDGDKLWGKLNNTYYDGDDIHPTYSFYTEKFLPFLAVELGLVEK